MAKRNSKYPNKSDYKPNVDMYMEIGESFGELPLSDPSESNSTKVFRKNESKTEGENEPSAFHQNKKRNKT